MNGKTKAKWVVGVTGTIFSAFVLTQFAAGGTDANSSKDQLDTVQAANMSEEEKKLTQLDWSNFTTSSISYSESNMQQSDRQTRRS
ncbi:hypothetical protein [Bacillus benzoevorans]|uniref:Uncharacterized protein n=1 Tax=Bacillus benzoevorans TaxID=1456 RepID=A0A7X0HQE7_9BACI|nr:hypothetical protein [Bacillus benzoevorans]MBB6443646.1 hypothetical protein [Bacillus benzoevorans]